MTRHKQQRAPGVPQTESQLEKLERHIFALSDRVARLEVKPNLSAEAIKMAVLSEFDSLGLRPLSVPKDYREAHPMEYERIVNVAWTNVAKRLAGNA